ncbi:phospholipase/Carboxylesterase family protein, partial [Chlamydia psittaci 06-1683]
DIILGGFSQGAMITTHLILSSKIPYRGALICSGALLLEKGWENNINLCAKVPFIQSHGYQDTILPYYHGERLNQLLSSRLHGEFISFNGGHEIPAVVLQKMQETIPLWTSTFN